MNRTRERLNRWAASCRWVATLLCIGAVSFVQADAPAGSADERRQYTFSWMFSDEDAMRPRGGTTRGADVTLATEPDAAYRRMLEPGLDKRERDRRAILAMAGGYRTSFDFIETLGFTAGYEPTQPYQSWGTEYVYVVEDEPEFVSLQHILVMTFATAEGAPEQTVVVKHWRQDWRYQDTGIHVYAGHDRWQRRALAADDVAGTWSQAVYQVDDSPRYQAYGRWSHAGNHATWTSSDTWRPLPRREFSVRDDYHVLAGTNRVTITPQGWVHEEDNLKVVLDADGQPAGQGAHLAREAGLNRYERIVGYDFSAGDEYWQRTGAFWAVVRAAWADRLDGNVQVALRDDVDVPLFQSMFELADRFAGNAFDADTAGVEVAATLDRYLQ